MIGFGGADSFPLAIGDDEAYEDDEFQAMLDALAPGWDSDDPVHAAECWAYAQATAMIWNINERVANQSIPERMMEHLPVWEEACKLRVALSDADVDRRNRLSAKLRGIAGNSIVDIESACRRLLGVNFSALVRVASADWVTYWAAVNPGPPGLEWSSNRARIAIRMNKDGLSEAEFLKKRTALIELMDSMTPAWMVFTIGVGNSFVVNQGVVGLTLL